MNDIQFKAAFKLAGGWFIIEYLEIIFNNFTQLENDKIFKNELIEHIYKSEGKPDTDIDWTRARINAVLRIIRGGRIIEAVEKTANSSNISTEYVTRANKIIDLINKLNSKGDI